MNIYLNTDNKEIISKVLETLNTFWIYYYIEETNKETKITITFCLSFVKMYLTLINLLEKEKKLDWFIS